MIHCFVVGIALVRIAHIFSGMLQAAFAQDSAAGILLLKACLISATFVPVPALSEHSRIVAERLEIED